ncbi:MAG: HlyD family efflux transporter periplasmic adaptor subunit [Acidobacteriota bacterium]|jgi:HlyD family secretion protein|nr:MAG: RND transporter [Acidobacteriota bacterium]
MDTPRDPAYLRRRRRRRWLAGVGVAAAVLSLSVAVSRLEPALPGVSESSLWIRTVQRGPLVREVRGTGTLVPEEIRWITASSAGRVERILLQPGARVEPGTVILELSNPDLQQSVRSAETDWQTAVAQLANQRATLRNTRFAQRSALVDAESAYELALADLDLHRSLAESGLVAGFTLKQKQALVDQARNRLELARQQLESIVESEPLQLAPAEAAVTQRRAEYERLLRQLDDLHVKSTMSGLLQAVSVEVGQQVAAGANLVRVSDPGRLKAEVRVAETQARDLAVGQPARVDTRTGVVSGYVSRIDPAAQGGTVGVDITLEGALPPGARPDLNVDATIELERLADVLFVESPAFGQEHGTISLFRVTGSRELERTTVRIGRRSVQYVEIVEGLAEGDRVVLSDMSQYAAFDRLRLQ